MSTPKVARRQIAPTPLRLTPAERAALRKPLSPVESAVRGLRLDAEEIAFHLRGFGEVNLWRPRRDGPGQWLRVLGRESAGR